MKYEPLETIIESTGLRLVLVQGFPSPWGQAVKAMMEYKGLRFRVAPQVAGGENTTLTEWAGVNSGPVVVWDDLQPLNRWNDILFLLERLAPNVPLIPNAAEERTLCLGLSHEICGELGIGWNRRLDMFRPIIESGEAPDTFQSMADKYGYNDIDVQRANERTVGTLEMLFNILLLQKEKECEFFVGNGVTAVDFYWAAFSNLCRIMSAEECPLDGSVRPMFENVPEVVESALHPLLLEHRDRMMQKYFKIPMEL